MNFFTPPTKRSNGQCNCGGIESYTPATDVVTKSHKSDCPALHPLQPQPGDGPDALARLTRLVREQAAHGTTNARRAFLAEQALALISEAAEEQKMLRESHTAWARSSALQTATIERLQANLSASDERGAMILKTKGEIISDLRAKLAAQQETITALSHKATTILRQGQEQGRVELATELLSEHGLHPTLATRLDEIVRDDAEH